MYLVTEHPAFSAKYAFNEELAQKSTSCVILRSSNHTKLICADRSQNNGYLEEVSAGKGHSWVLDIVYILIWVVDTWVYSKVKIHQAVVHLKLYIHCIVNLNKKINDEELK